MISAGRVLIMPKGAFDINTQYEMLDLVSYNGSSYLALTTTIGNLPTDTTKWMLSAYGGNAANVAGNFAVIETTDIATVTHNEGTLFIDENSQFMKATQTINIGDTIVSGTNCTPTTVEQLLNEITAYIDGLDSQNRKLYGGTEIAAQTDLHSLAIGEYYKSRTTFYVTNGPDGISNVTSAVFRLTIEAALKDGSTASSPLLLTLRTPDGKIYTQNFDGSTWGEWTILSEQIEAAKNGIADIVNVLGAKNLLKVSASNMTLSGVTFNVNSDTSISVNGTATSDVYYSLGVHNFGNVSFSTDGSTNNSNYKINGLPTNSQFYLFYNAANHYVNIVVKSGYTVDNVRVYPMIRPKNIEDATWQPYTKTNKELTKEVTQNSSDIQTLTNNVQTLSNKDTAIESEISDIVNVLGAKNLLLNAAITQVKSGITFTIYSDGSVKANGTASDNIWFVLTADDNNVNLPLEHGKDYILSGCPSEGSNDNYYLYVEQYYDGAYQTNKDYGNGVQFTGHSRTKDAVAIYVKSGTVMSNLMFYPMIRPASIKDSTYVPYAKTNRELSEYCLTDYSNFEEISDYVTETYQTFSAPYSGWYYASASTGGTTNSPFLRLGIPNGYVFAMHGRQEAYSYVTSPVIFIKKGTTMVAQGNSGCINKLFIKKCNL